MAITDTNEMLVGNPWIISSVAETLADIDDVTYYAIGVNYIAPKAGTITKIGVAISVVNGTGGTYDIGLQGIADGQIPDGTWLDDGGGNAAVIAQSASALGAGYHWVTLTNDYDVSAGEQITAVIESNTVDGTNYTDFSQSYLTLFGSNAGFPTVLFDNTDGSTWQQGSDATTIAVQYSDGTIIPGVITAHDAGNLSWNSSDNPNEYGVLYTPEVDVRLAGALTSFRLITDPTSDMTMRVYDTDGSTVLASLVIDMNEDHESTGFRMQCLRLTSKPTLTAGSTYRIAFEATGAGDIRTIRWTTSDTAALTYLNRGLIKTGTNNPAGGWTDYDNGVDGFETLALNLIIDGVETPGAGGGSAVPIIR